jgi:inward rectifier potassium channel
MPILNRTSPLFKQNDDTGFGIGSSNGQRFVNRDGTFNVRREGGSALNRYSIYNYLLSISTGKFILIILTAFFLINLSFTAIYLAMGSRQFAGIEGNNLWEHAVEIFFFSTQTFTTVGYGRINPVGFIANLAAALEALSGLMSFALMTGLIYGRFAKPRANLLFSDIAVVAPYRGITGLMFRLVSSKEFHSLTDLSVKVNVGLQVMEDDKPVYKFFVLDLERNRVDSLPMNFTVVHPINEKSPLWNMNEADMETADVELYVLVRAYDDVYSATVQQRTSYIFKEIKHGVKFVPMYHESADGSITIIEMDKLNETKSVENVGS